MKLTLSINIDNNIIRSSIRDLMGEYEDVAADDVADDLLNYLRDTNYKGILFTDDSLDKLEDVINELA